MQINDKIQQSGMHKKVIEETNGYIKNIEIDKHTDRQINIQADKYVDEQVKRKKNRRLYQRTNIIIRRQTDRQIIRKKNKHLQLDTCIIKKNRE